MTEHYELTNVPCQGEKCAVAPKVGFGEPIRIPPRPFSVIAGLISTAASLVGTQDRWLSEPRLPRGRAIRASTVVGLSVVSGGEISSEFIKFHGANVHTEHAPRRPTDQELRASALPPTAPK